MILLLRLMVSGSSGKDPAKHLGKFINLCPIDSCATIYMLKVMHVLNAFPEPCTQQSFCSTVSPKALKIYEFQLSFPQSYHTAMQNAECTAPAAVFIFRVKACLFPGHPFPSSMTTVFILLP